MLYAKNNSTNRLLAQPRSKAICGICSSPVLSKCGSIKIWHWSHESLGDCDTWAEKKMSAWHFDWQDKVKEDCR